MLLRHSLIYVVARGIPGVLNFLSISIYTRLLFPDEYGRYTLLLAVVSFLNVVLFQWLRLALLRFLPKYENNPQVLLSTILTTFAVLGLAVGVAGLLIACLYPDPTWRGLLLCGIPLLWFLGWLEMTLELVRTRLLPARYGFMSGIKAIVSLVVGVSAILGGLGEYGPLLGMAVGAAVVGVIWGRSEWRGASLAFSKKTLFQLLRYGLPLTATFALGFVVNMSDRFIIARFLGEEEAGIYAASYDLANQSLTLLMMIVGLAFGPLVIRVFEENGAAAVQAVVAQNWVLLFMISLPLALSIATLAPEISIIFLGEDFRQGAEYLLPLVSLGSLLAGLRAYHFDHAFRIGHWTMGQFWLTLVTAIANLAFNFLLIPSWGLVGAALATVLSYALALIVSIILGRRVFRFAFPLRQTLSVMVAGGGMVLVLLRGASVPLPLGPIARLVLAIVVYVVLLYRSGLIRWMLVVARDGSGLVSARRPSQ